MRKKLVVGNWKLNGSIGLASEMKATLEASDFHKAAVALCPPLTLSTSLMSGSYLVGAQDVSQHGSGAFTGEVSATMLSEAGIKLVIVGHSERREYHAETDAVVAKKAEQVLAVGLTPIVCFGEEESVRDSGNYIEHCIAQVAAVLEYLGNEKFANIVLAYEPVWAIGTGKTASPEQAQEVHDKVRQYLAQQDATMAAGIQILYGGSVKGANATELFSQADVDGGLIGGASLKADDFLAICQAAEALS